MKVNLPKVLEANGGTVGIKIDFSFTSPDYGSDRMGVLETKNGRIFTLAQWYPRMSVYDDVSGWNTLPYLGARFVISFPLYFSVPGMTSILVNPRSIMMVVVAVNTIQKR